MELTRVLDELAVGCCEAGGGVKVAHTLGVNSWRDGAALQALPQSEALRVRATARG